jgi:predicted metal-dependent HD superfamily phosphohydrolase
MHARWSALWRKLGSNQVPNIGVLLTRFGEQHRHYHTLAHIRHCLTVYDRGPSRDDVVELALWFHDAIYYPRNHDNEERSADWCREWCQCMGIATEIEERVVACILATRHQAEPRTASEALTVAIDLSILGEAPERFRAYDHQIRREYAWVPMETYRRERARVLRGFLERPAIYPHPWWERRFGRQARINLRRALQALGIHGPGTPATTAY